MSSNQRPTNGDAVRPGRPASPPLAETPLAGVPGHLRVGEPLVEGALALYPVYAEERPVAPPYTTGRAALAAGLLEVREAGEGHVPELLVRNRGALPVLLTEGEMLVGARQNRVLNVTVLVAAASELVVPVSCVEAHRWGAPQAVRASAYHASPSLRSGKLASTHAAHLATGVRRSDQGGVWDRVAATRQRVGARGRTEAFEDAFEASAAARRALPEAPGDGQVGVVAAFGGRVVAFDVFDRPETLATYWSAILAGCQVEATGAHGPAPTAEEAERCVAAVLEARGRTVAAVGLGTEVHLDAGDMVGAALLVEGAAVHVAGFARV